MRRTCVHPSIGTNALQSLYGYLKKLFPKYPKRLKIRQNIEIPLEAQKWIPFNYLSKRSGELIQAFRAIQRIREQHLARFMLEESLQLITTYFFLSSFLSFYSPTARLGQCCNILAVYMSHTVGRTPLNKSHRPLPAQHTTNTTDEHPYRQRDSKPRSH